MQKHDHKRFQTNKYSNESKCVNSAEGHMAECNDCEMEQKERVIKKMQADVRVGRQKALQIIRGKKSLQEQTLFHTLHISHAK